MMSLMQGAAWFVVLVFCLVQPKSGIASGAENLTDFEEMYYLNSTVIQDIYQSMQKLAAKSPEIFWELPHNLMLKPQPGLSNSMKPLHSPSNYIAQSYHQCTKDLLSIPLSLKKPWAIQMIDAFGKPQSGLLKGEMKWIGNYDECLAVKAPPSIFSDQGFSGRYCWLSFALSLPSKVLPSGAAISIGACLPSSCAHGNDFFYLYDAVDKFLKHIPFVRKVAQAFPMTSATFVPEDQPLNSASIVCICLCSFFALLVLLGTLIDGLQKLNLLQTTNSEQPLPVIAKKPDEEEISTISTEQLNNSINISHENEQNDIKDDVKLIVTPGSRCQSNCLSVNFLLCFSAITNGQAILNTSSAQGQLQCLHGIRFFSMAWVILGHTYVFGFGVFGNFLDVMQTLNSWPFQVILQGTFSVDTFFLLSGCLLTYLFLKNPSQISSVKQWIYFYVHRYVRLTPVYAIMIFVLATWWGSLGNGPFWTLANNTQCSKTWWWNLFYINNFVAQKDLCMGWSWYLANDMQFFVISPLFLIAFKRNKTAGLVIVTVLLTASWITTGVYTRVNDFSILFTGEGDNVAANQEKNQEVFDKMYVKPYIRIGPYLIGVLLGYVLTEVKGEQKFLHKGAVVLGWVASQTLSLVLLYGLLHANLGTVTTSAYNTLSRSAWSITVAWVVFACLTGHGGPVNNLLSWKGWIPLSRLTYCAYLVHPMVMGYFYNSSKVATYYNTSQMTLNYLGFITLSYGVAFIASLLFEAPIMKLEKLLKKK